MSFLYLCPSSAHTFSSCLMNLSRSFGSPLYGCGFGALALSFLFWSLTIAATYLASSLVVVNFFFGRSLLLASLSLSSELSPRFLAGGPLGGAPLPFPPNVVLRFRPVL